jgi:hypothetical protein
MKLKRTNMETTDLAGPMATKSPDKSPADVLRTFRSIAPTALIPPLEFDLEAFMLTPASTSHDWNIPTYMYVIQSMEFCKVGISNNVARRMIHFRAGNPHPLPVLATFRFGSKLTALLAERTTHGVLAQYSIGREWFHITPELAVNAARVVTEATRAVRKLHHKEVAAKRKAWFAREAERAAKLELVS